MEQRVNEIRACCHAGCPWIVGQCWPTQRTRCALVANVSQSVVVFYPVIISRKRSKIDPQLLWNNRSWHHCRIHVRSSSESDNPCELIWGSRPNSITAPKPSKFRILPINFPSIARFFLQNCQPLCGSKGGLFMFLTGSLLYAAALVSAMVEADTLFKYVHQVAAATKSI